MARIGSPESRITCGARGLPGSVTLAGPPEKITPLGFIRAKAASALEKGAISE